MRPKHKLPTPEAIKKLKALADCLEREDLYRLKQNSKLVSRIENILARMRGEK